MEKRCHSGTKASIGVKTSGSEKLMDFEPPPIMPKETFNTFSGRVLPEAQKESS
jgi:hypothetical protein